jgi:hypothetical protein
MAAVVGLLALGDSLGSGRAGADIIAWPKQGAFEACLESTLGSWLKEQAALVVNEDPAAGNVDDMVVAKWTLDTLALCKSRAGNADPESEDRFTKHMAQWRRHIYDLASSIRQRGISD